MMKLADSVFPDPLSPLMITAWLRPPEIIVRCAAAATAYTCGGTSSSDMEAL